MKKLIIAMLLTATFVHAGEFLRVCENPEIGNVTVRVQIIPANTPPEPNEVVLGSKLIQNVRFYGRLSASYALPECDPKYYVWSAPNVVEADAGQKAAIDAALAAQTEEQKTVEADIGVWTDKEKAFAKVLLDEINILRDKAGLNPRTIDQLKTAIKNKL